MGARILVASLAFLAALAPAAGHAAASLQPLTTLRNSVAGGESQVFSVRAFDALGQPAAGERVHFSNDACGFFPSGGFSTDVVTDAAGTASTEFTARAQGIYCWIVADAGARVTFDVLTYLPSNVYFDARTLPPDPKPGEPVSLEVSAKVGIYDIYNADIAAAIVPGSGNASLAPSTSNSGQSGSVSFALAPADGGDFDVALQFHGVAQRVTVHMSPTPWQDMWWAGWGENGWGMSIAQHRDVLFSVIYAYDAAGRPTWYVMPGGSWNAQRTVYSGSLYLPHGSPYAAYDAARFVPGAALGQASLDFSDPANVLLSYTIGGVSGRKSITRQPFGPADDATGIAVGDMWWGGAAQNGWGVAILQQYRTLFGVWFTYGASGAPTWYVMPSGFWSDAQTWEGRIYRTTSSPWLGQPYDKSLLKEYDVGSYRLRFSDDAATFDYVIDGQAGSAAIARQPF